jgi:hypothetical protein
MRCQPVLIKLGNVSWRYLPERFVDKYLGSLKDAAVLLYVTPNLREAVKAHQCFLELKVKFCIAQDSKDRKMQFGPALLRRYYFLHCRKALDQFFVLIIDLGYAYRILIAPAHGKGGILVSHVGILHRSGVANQAEVLSKNLTTVPSINRLSKVLGRRPNASAGIADD